MSYGLKYIGSFDSTAEESYRMEILAKDYLADTPIQLEVTGAPVRHSWQTDEPKAPVKGSSLVLTFYAQKDVPMTNYTANISLVFDTGYIGASEKHFMFLVDSTYTPVIGQPFTVSEHPDGANGSWTPIDVIDTGGGDFTVEVTTFTAEAGTFDAIITAGIAGVQLINFYSPNDDQFKGRFYWNEQLLFEGFLVQDDCHELMADYRHEVSLSFNDNIGLLKDVALNAYTPDYGGHPVTAEFDFNGGTGDCFIYFNDLTSSEHLPLVATPFTIFGHISPAANGTWTPTAVTNYRNGNITVQVADFSFVDMPAYSCRIEGNTVIDFYGRNSLLNIIGICIQNTNLQLNTRIYVNIFEESDDVNDSFLAQTFIDTRTFFQGDSFDNCYDVLTYILGRFHLTLFQAYGRWNIVRWDEIRYYPDGIPYFEYDYQFNLVDTGVMTSGFTTGFQQLTYPEEGLEKSIFRPFQFVKETFNYNQPKFIIINSDLQTLGTFDSTSTVDGFRYDVYEFPESSKWVHFFPGDAKVDTSKIVVKTNVALDEEVERYVYQPYNSAGGSGGAGVTYNAGVQFNDIQVTAGDEMDFEIKIKSASAGSGVRWYFVFMIVPNESEYYGLTKLAGAGNSFAWSHISGVPNNAAFLLTHDVADADAENYLDFRLSTEGVQLKVPAFPVDGVLRIRVDGNNTSSLSAAEVDAIWKDIKLTITQRINDSTNVIGHIHKDEQELLIKNNEDIELNMDDSPRTPIAGTLFKTAYSGIVLQRTRNWSRATYSEALRIGNITTLEQLFWRRIPRTKLEGTFYGLVQDTHISMLAAIKNVAVPDLNFVFGSLEIEYRNNTFNCTQWEICDDNEMDTDLTGNYTFTYIYDAK